MYLKMLTQNRQITIDYFNNGALNTLKGRVYSLNLKEQLLSLKDENKVVHSIRLSRIKQII
ncbi:MULTISPECIES: YolD-like family protein [Bacillaceae]|uniref:YolD-like family protein n=1 Tax=Bacillaceae TaxID=186817 RepID=UPI002FFFD3DC